MSTVHGAKRWLVCSLLLLFSLFATALFTTGAFGTVPGLISYQGRITTDLGDPVTDGNYDLTFGLYPVLESGQPLWSESQTAVPVTSGVFSVILGSLNPIPDSAFAGPETYLEIQVSGDAISPRTLITSNAFAQRVATVDGASGGIITAPLILVPDESGAGFTFSREVSPEASLSSSIQLTIEDLTPSISLWEPVDSRALPGQTGAVKKVAMSRDGIVMFGATETDTNLIVAPNGDIVGVGQITMGENSSSGIETSVLGFRNTAQGDSSTIGGGSENVTTGTIAVIAGGHLNTASAEGSVISGGSNNTNSGLFGTIGGGFSNSLSGSYATIPGGDFNVADGNFSFAIGHRAKALHGGSFVWADQTDADFSSTEENQFIIRAGGGVGIGTDSPVGQLHVVSAPGDSSVNLPGDAISAPEILNEPGVANNRSAGSTALTQGSATMEQLLSTTLTIPTEGYIIVTGGATLEGTGASKGNQAFLQIDDAVGGGLADPFYARAGNGDHDGPSQFHYSNMNVQRVFYKSAGTHTFYLEALANPGNDDGAITTMQRPHITAIFVPTAYGTVADTP